MSNGKKSEYRHFNGNVNIPLYKYYGNYDYAKDAIQNKRVHLESPCEYNDIYDSTFYLTEYGLKRACNTSYNICNIMKGFLAPKYHNALNDCQAKISLEQFSVYDAIAYICAYDSTFSKENLVDECIVGITHGFPIQASNNKISCFSERYDSLLMWAYYANNARGICLEFNAPLDNILKIHCHKVQYTHNFQPDPSGFDYYFYKSEQWAHEQEWRIVCDTNEEYISITSLSKIILGCKTPIQEQIEFIELGRKYHIDVYEIRPSNKKFELLLYPIHQVPSGELT